MGTPSILQQRMVLVAFLLAIGAVVWWQNVDGNSDYLVQKFSQTPLPDVFDELDFTSAESAWSGLTIDSHGNLQIDALTETALVEALAIVQGHASELPMARLAFLLEKQFGASGSQQIMELLPILRNYKEAEQRWWAENGGRNPPPHEELFDLQDELLGETLAQKLFSEQRRMAKLMLANHQIRNDPGLSQTEKDQALRNLQNTFEQKGAPVE